MSLPEPLHPKPLNPRKRAPGFTHRNHFHQPHLDLYVPEEDLHLVPAELSMGKRLNCGPPRPPRPPVAQLHVMITLTNDHDELQKEFHDKIPQINDVLELWSKVKAASPTTTGEAQLRARASVADRQTWISAQEGQGPRFNLVSNLDTRERADIIYLSDAAEGSEEHAEDSGVPSNLRTIEWLGFDGSYVHTEDVEPQNTTLPTEPCFEVGGLNIRRNSTPSNLRTTEWLNDEQLP